MAPTAARPIRRTSPRQAIVAAAIDAGGAKRATRAALHSWVTRHSYLKALVADGALRCGLDGQAVEAVDPQHQAEAASKLIAAIDEAKAKRAAARPSPEMQEEGANDLSRDPARPNRWRIVCRRIGRPQHGGRSRDAQPV